MTTAALHRLYGILLGLVVLVGGYLFWRQHERSVGAIAVVTQAVRDSAKVVQDSLAQSVQQARSAEQVRQVALGAAQRQIARQRADSARQDSIVRVSANERQKAEAALRDSLVSAGELRTRLAALDASSRADSAAWASDRGAFQRTVGSLLAVVHADSLTIQAERQRADRAEQLAALRARETALVRKQAPSTAGTVVRDVLWAAAGYGFGRLVPLARRRQGA